MRKEYRAICMPRRLRRGRLKMTPFTKPKTKRWYTWQATITAHCNLSLPAAAGRTIGYGYEQMDMSRIAPEYLDREPSDCPTAADVLFWKEPVDKERRGR